VRAPILDTHAWIWWVQADRRLDRRTVETLDALPPDDRPAICDISLWEVAMLVSLGRLTLGEPLESWLEAAADPRSVRVLPISPATAAEVAKLPTSFHRDPADRVIVASCRVLGYALLTRDRAIVSARLVRRWRPE
jgi:PIN domain nuclease of toxin-antitoxin system